MFRDLWPSSPETLAQITSVSFAIEGFGLPKISGKVAPMSSEAAKRLGEAAKARRKELRWKREKIHANGGPSTTTQVKIERGEVTEPPNGTLDKIDAGLDWVEGSAARIFYDGGQPIAKPRAGNNLGDALLLASDLGPLGRLIKIRDQLDLVIADLRGEYPTD